MGISNLHFIVGLGATGISCARYLTQQNIPFLITDTRADPPPLSSLKNFHPNGINLFRKWNANVFDEADKIILSPGISLNEPIIAQQIKRGITVVGDIELFAKAVDAPVIAITGTNAKSTVTTLVGKMAIEAGFNVKVGGNLGVPALDLLTQKNKTDLFVLELSSFQLETTYSLKPHVATMLNLTPDHMDRYKNLQEYQQAKYRVYQHCQVAICNRDDPLTECNLSSLKNKFHFTLGVPNQNEFGLIEKNNQTYLAFEDQPLCLTRDIPVQGKHYQANALAALAIGHGFGLPFEPMLKVLREFNGLPHRCQLILELNGVKWYNDSKGTNVGASQAAIEGLGSEITGKLILIAGGVGKNADFRPLVPVIKKYVRHVVLIGEAANDLAKVIGNEINISFAATMDEAVRRAKEVALSHDSVLLSPACASFDMFKNYEHRGEVFTELVNNLR